MHEILADTQSQVESWSIIVQRVGVSTVVDLKIIQLPRGMGEFLKSIQFCNTRAIFINIFIKKIRSREGGAIATSRSSSSNPLMGFKGIREWTNLYY